MTPAIVSRCRIFQFKPLEPRQIIQAMEAALKDKERGLGDQPVEATPEAFEHWARMACGDVRTALGALELAVLTTQPGEDGVIRIDLVIAQESIQQPAIRCGEDQYYDMLSAFCKSLRGSDSDAALCWFARLITAGVDPRLIARRMVVHASEDVGLANPIAMLQAEAAARALEAVGMPEARIPMAQAIIAICESPKSDSVIKAVEAAFADAGKGHYAPVPVHLRDTHYQGAQQLGNGRGYLYPHDFPGHYVKQTYLPEELKGRRYYEPTQQGHEATVYRNKQQREEASS